MPEAAAQYYLLLIIKSILLIIRSILLIISSINGSQHKSRRQMQLRYGVFMQRYILNNRVMSLSASAKPGQKGGRL